MQKYFSEKKTRFAKTASLQINSSFGPILFNFSVAEKEKQERPVNWKKKTCFAKILFAKTRSVKKRLEISLSFRLKAKGKGYGIRLYSPYRRCWFPFLGPSARKCNGGLGACHPVLSHTLPVYLPQISPGTHLELSRLCLSLQSHATDPRPKRKNRVHWDSNPRPLRQGIPKPAHQPTRPGRLSFRLHFVDSSRIVFFVFSSELLLFMKPLLVRKN